MGPRTKKENAKMTYSKCPSERTITKRRMTMTKCYVCGCEINERRQRGGKR